MWYYLTLIVSPVPHLTMYFVRSVGNTDCNKNKKTKVLLTMEMHAIIPFKTFIFSLYFRKSVSI
jgi:hypothetical protein